MASPPSVSKPIELIAPKLLIGEGVEEQRFFQSFLKHLAIDDVQVAQYAGKAGLGRFLRTLRGVSGFSSLVSLGITRDADDSATSAFQSVCTSLKNAYLPAPDKPGATGKGRPNVSVFVLPDGAGSGMLEDLCLSSVSNDTGMQCVDEFLTCVREKTNRTPDNLSKARAHVWLASKPRAGLRLGEAAENGYWPWGNDAFDSLRSFLQAL